MKRLHQALDSEGSYNQVGFSYDDEKKSGEDSESPKRSEPSAEEDEAFVPEVELEIPEDMVIVSIQVIKNFSINYYTKYYHNSTA